MEKPHYIEEHVLLAPYTTLGIGGHAEYFACIDTHEKLSKTLEWAECIGVPVTLLGGGSNVLISDHGVDGMVIKMAIGGIAYASHFDESVLVTVGAGVVFDDLVLETVERGLWGLENLSLIPGTVGGVPIQNVGAYGVEARDVVYSVQVYDREMHELTTLTNATCAFAYRDSVFKHEGKNRYIVTAVTFILSTKYRPQIAYADLKKRFGESNTPTQKEIRATICYIRSKKFPDWHVMGTAGSFFKNPVVESETHTRLRTQFPDLPTYESENGMYKIALGWILDRVLALKGKRVGNVGLYSEQALVLVNHGDATATEVIAFSDRIIKNIFDATGLSVDREVVYVQ